MNGLLGFLLLLSVCGLSLSKNPPIPVFANNYKVQGVLSLPYAELNEHFIAWFDGEAKKSRSDFYGDLFKVYQFGPNATSSDNKYGSLYKFVWVPASFHSKFNKHVDWSNSKTATRRACFEIKGSDTSSIGPQTVLPNLEEFTFDSIGACPPTNIERSLKCELWKLTTNVGDKRNVYKVWVTRNPSNNSPIPVHYYMQGYDSLLGSHYDRYDVIYTNYIEGGAKEEDFLLDAEKAEASCESMFGPEENDTSSARANTIVQNPLHEFISEPHRYDHLDKSHASFIDSFSKSFDTTKARRESWVNLMHNTRFINAHNRKVKHYKLSVNQFADNKLHELSYLRGRRHSKREYNGGLDYDSSVFLQNQFGAGSAARLMTPTHWDWRLNGAVTPVKDQAVCGSCWSFGTSGAIEGAYFVQSGGKLVRLSQQQMIDCSWPEGNFGCDGGEDSSAYRYIMKTGGLASEEDYGAYEGVDGKCQDQEVRKTVKLTGFYNITSKSAEALKDALVRFGPVTVAIDASRPTFTFYSHGVYYDDKCNNSVDGLDHQVLVVGFGTLDGQDYWLVKNSWSTYWGNDGYILIAARDNNCGVMTAPTVPIVARA